MASTMGRATHSLPLRKWRLEVVHHLLTKAVQNSDLYPSRRRTIAYDWKYRICHFLWRNSRLVVGELSHGAMGVLGVPLEVEREDLEL